MKEVASELGFTRDDRSTKRKGKAEDSAEKHRPTKCVPGTSGAREAHRVPHTRTTKAGVSRASYAASRRLDFPPHATRSH